MKRKLEKTMKSLVFPISCEPVHISGMNNLYFTLFLNYLKTWKVVKKNESNASNY